MTPVFVIALLALNVAAAEWLVRNTRLRHFGSALIVIVLTAVCANVGLLPTVGEGSPVYDVVFEFITPLGIFWLLLSVNLRSVAAAGLPMVVLFLIGSVGTFLGVMVGLAAIGGREAFGELTNVVCGMFVATYTGGSANYNAVAYEFGIATKDPVLFAGAAAVDSAMTTVWMVFCVAIPRLFAGLWGSPKRRLGGAPADLELTTRADRVTSTPADDQARVDVLDLAILLALGMLGLGISEVVGSMTRTPSILVLTVIALVLAQVEVVQRLAGARVLGLFAILVFLAVIGALCDAASLIALGPIGLRLIAFVAITFAVHGALIFGSARALGLSLEEAAVASQAGIGGGTTSLALAKSLSREDLELPGLLVGSIGTVLGTFLGLGAAQLLD